MAKRSVFATAVASFEPNNGREPVAPKRFLQSQSDPNIDWSGIVGAGENPAGVTMITPNGVAHLSGAGYNQSPYGNWNKRADGERWDGPVDWARFGGNRTGE